MIKEAAQIGMALRRSITVVLILQFVSCTSTPPLPEFPKWHPANPNADESPAGSRPGLIDEMDINNPEMNMQASTRPAPGNPPEPMKE